ncbi:MAG: hypothetical protein KAQ92_05250 [Candidatus Aenigmarchaeota archaeon]|nr:hypothetical protein [Candidatus Aenigmarchaeota archaeon]
MEEGVKIVVGIMVALIIAFALVFIFSERLTGANENIMEPTQDSSEKSIKVTMCKTIHGDGDFLITSKNQDGTCDASDCDDKYLLGTSGGDCTEVLGNVGPPIVKDKCCCKCKDF